MAENIKNVPEYDLLDEMTVAQILQILQSIGSVNYREADFCGTARQFDRVMTKIKKIILDHVRTCIL